MEKRAELVLGFLMLVMVAALSERGFDQMKVNSTGVEILEKEKVTVVIDAGHGGEDPGKVSASGALEKDINLIIAKKLKQFLENADIRVVMTREEDCGLYNETDGNKKTADLRRRCELMEESGPVLVVSIHQNSYPAEDVRGPQVFYYAKSEEGRKLAEQIQASFSGLLGEENTRMAKGNGEYYLLLHVKQPIVIVECGFLSNPAEAEQLQEEWYQEKLAWVIHMGILQYLNGESVA